MKNNDNGNAKAKPKSKPLPEKEYPTNVKVAPKVKKLKKASMATICAEVIRDNPKANFNALCKKVEVAFKERGILSYLIQNAVNDTLDILNVK